MKLANMERDEKAQASQPIMACEGPKYPYGLCIHLEEESLKKLGITELPAVGASMVLHAKVEVTAVSKNESKEGGEHRSLSLQITEMALGSEKKKDTAETLYGS